MCICVRVFYNVCLYVFFYVGICVSKCIVCVSGYDPLTFSSLSFSFLIGKEFYGPSYLKC